MPVESVTLASMGPVVIVFKVTLLLISIFYLLFAMIVVRQVNLMTETIITELTPFIRFLSVLHAGLAFGVIVLFLGMLFF